MNIEITYFDQKNEQIIKEYTLINDKGMRVSAINYGCIITKVLVPDRKGKIENVVLGFDTLADYEKYSPYFGAVVGRFAGRIKGGVFDLDGETYHLAKNNGQNHLHGGIKGFDKAVWECNTEEKNDHVSLTFSYDSRDGEEGYPGNLALKVTYTLTNENELLINYEAISDKRTLLNITNHTYFNLSGNLKRSILDHELTLKSKQFLELDNELIPTGNLINVEGTVFDFQFGRKIIEGVESSETQNQLAGNGYDHPFILSENGNKEIELYDEESGRLLTVETDQPAVVLYTGNQLESNFSFGDIQSKRYLGLCLETQGFPDSIHHEHFPSSILEKNVPYQSTTKYRFS